MALLEALLMMAAQATTPPPPKSEPPPLELLEFLGDWTEDEGSLIDSEKPRDRGSSRKPRDSAERDAKGTKP